MKSYDCLGKIFFNLNDLTRAKFFHDKMINEDYEKEDSCQRKMGIIKLKSKGYVNNLHKNSHLNNLQNNSFKH